MATNLIEFLRKLLSDDKLQQDFAHDPGKALDHAGLSHLTAADVHDALVLLRDESSQHGDFSRHYETGSNTIAAAPVVLPPQPHSHPDAHHGGHHPESAGDYLSRYITTNHTDDRDTTTDHSVHQNIDNHAAREARIGHDGITVGHATEAVGSDTPNGTAGTTPSATPGTPSTTQPASPHHDAPAGTFDQDIDVHDVTASGDGAIAAGNDVHGTVTAGDHNQVGDHNVAGQGNVTGNNNAVSTGDGNTSSFGSGAAKGSHVAGDVSVGRGGAASGTDTATVNDTDNGINHSFNDQSHEATHGSFNEDIDAADHSDHSVHHSLNDEHDQSSHTSTATHDSGNHVVHAH